MPIHLHLRKYSLDEPVTSDDESSALQPHYLSAVHVFFFVDAVCCCDLFVGIAQQRHIQIELFPELFLRITVVCANADYGGAFFLYLHFRIAEPACLFRSPRCIRLGIEEENDILVAEVVLQIHRSSAIVGEGKEWSFISFFHHRSSG